jgi:hypothetical protein
MGTDARHNSHVPKRKKHYSHDESVDEPAGLIEDEACDIEQEAPAEENEPQQSIDKDDEADNAAFEEESGR